MLAPRSATRASSSNFRQGNRALAVQSSHQMGFDWREGAHGEVICRSRLGGILNFYLREAA
jgi:hypothetical protein